MQTQQRWRQVGAFGLITMAAIGFVAGRLTHSNAAFAGPPDKHPVPEADKRYVAYLHGGKVAITREDFGEYLIARSGNDKIETFVNKVIIDTACRERGIEVTTAEINAALQEDLKGINVKQDQFVEAILKKRGLTLYEWKEDVIRPRLQLGKLAKFQITVNEDEIKQAFDSEFGEQREGRIIIWPKEQERFALQQYDQIRASDGGFDEMARQQPISSLAATGGRIKPFGRGTGTNPDLEREAFNLKVGQVSTLISSKEGIVCFKLDQIHPPNAEANLDQQREKLQKIVYEKKVQVEVPKYFAELRKAADPKIFIKKNITTGELEHEVERQIGYTEPAKK